MQRLFVTFLLLLSLALASLGMPKVVLGADPCAANAHEVVVGLQGHGGHPATDGAFAVDDGTANGGSHPAHGPMLGACCAVHCVVEPERPCHAATARLAFKWLLPLDAAAAASESIALFKPPRIS